MYVDSVYKYSYDFKRPVENVGSKSNSKAETSGISNNFFFLFPLPPITDIHFEPFGLSTSSKYYFYNIHIFK